MNPPEDEPAPRFVTCRCQYCDGRIEFDANQLSDQNNVVPCPHCGLETVIFVPPPSAPPLLPSPPPLPPLERRGPPPIPPLTPVEAAKLLRSAAEQGDAEAQFWLAGEYATGHGLPQDEVEAYKWGRMAAEQGLAKAQYGLASCYAMGRGVPQNFVEAYKWANLAAAQDLEEARVLREAVAEQMIPAQIAEGQRRAAAFAAKKNRPAEGADSFPERRFLEDADSFGTGFFITEDGFLLTNHHVIENATQISALTKQGKVNGNVVKADAVNDMAVLKLEGRFHALPLASSRKVKLGDSVFTIGFPNPVVQGIEPKLTRGEISSLGGIRDDPRHFQTSVPLQPGNSGGPLVDKSGNVVGIVVASLSDLATLEQTGSLPQGVNYAVKSSMAFTLLESLPELNDRLKKPRPAEGREFADVVSEVQEAVVLIATD